MNPDFMGYSSERALIQAADYDSNAHDLLRRYARGIAESEIKQMLARPRLENGKQTTALIRAAMAMLDRAFVRYTARQTKGDTSYSFSKYFRWWVRQAAATELERAD